MNKQHMVSHEYFRLDLSIVWETVQADLPMLKKSLLGIQGQFINTE